MPESEEEVRERYFWVTLLRGFGLLLSLLVLLGLLWLLNELLGWWPYLVLSILGLLAGAAITVALLASVHYRAVVTIALGAIALPILAAYLSGIAARSPAEFTVYAASFLPFLIHAVVALLIGLWISRAWRGRPQPPPPAAQEQKASTSSQGAMP